MLPAIELENLGKRYCLTGDTARPQYRTLRESVMDLASRPLRRWRAHGTDGAQQEFWALKDVNLQLRAGEVVGIVGRNGAGKSTLLKILSRITKPTTGQARIHGRIGSLLEVGTGFHPELTGRENIFLNGSILGMSLREIARRFDEIVAFAEVDRFLDTPVKRYSSGMYVRLAFAVAAHIEPEILLVDEVLAVGDYSFQKKCLGKMGAVGRSGRTVLFVSHQLAAIEGLCNRCLLFDRGQLEYEGDTRDVLTRYQAKDAARMEGYCELAEHPGRTTGSVPCMTEVTLASGTEEPVAALRMGSPLEIRVKFACSGRPVRPVLGIVLKTQIGAPLFGINNRLIPSCRFEGSLTAGTIVCRLEKLPLMPGLYTLDLYFGTDSHDIDVVKEAVTFEVTPADVFGSGRLPGAETGPIFCPATFAIEG